MFVICPRSSPSADTPEPMQLGRTRLTTEECQCGFKANLCLYCEGHRICNSPVKGVAQQNLGEHCWILTKAAISRPLTPVHLGSSDLLLTCRALIDSGLDTDFIDLDLTHKLHLQLVPLPQPVRVRAVDNHLLHLITHTISPVHMVINDHHFMSFNHLTPDPR